MTDPQYEQVEQRLRRFIESSQRQYDGYSYKPAAGETAVLEQADTIEKILDRFYPEWRTHVGGNTRYAWQRHHDAAVRCLARLREQEEVSEMLGQGGPSLAADALHEWVWEAAHAAWEGGNFTDAVDAAARNVNARLRRKVGRSDINEGPLVQQAFSLSDPKPDQPRLRVHWATFRTTPFVASTRE